MTVSRRQFVAGAGASVVVAFDPLNHGWLNQAKADSCDEAVSIPRLDGVLSYAEADIEEGSEDFGYLVSRRPMAVLQPGSIRDVQKVVRFANRHGLKIAARGQAHSTFGQAQAECGIVIDTRPLNNIGRISRRGVWAECGARWDALVQACVEEGFTPRVLTDYIGLSIGGVLSVGGIGGGTNRHGFVADNVEALEVVTADGRLRRVRRGELFHSVLGGLGQFGLIVRAKISLDAAPTHARIFNLTYASREAFLADQRCVAFDERFDFLEGQLVANAAGEFQFLLQGGVYFTAGDEPDNGCFIGDLSFDSSEITDFDYFAWCNRVAPVETALRGIGLWEGVPHPWSDIFLSDRTLETYLDFALQELRPADLGAGLALLYPFKRRNLRHNARSVQVPRSRLVWAFDLLRFPFDPTLAEPLLEQNRVLFDYARDLGGRRYPVGALEFSQADWMRHYGRNWFSFVFKKGRFDPCNTLTPGQGIFRR